MRRNRFLKGGMNQQAKNYSSAIEKILAGEVDYAFRLRARIILENLFLLRPKKILDLGCGRGFYLEAAGKLLPEAKILGVDKNSGYLKKARNYVQADNVAYLKADITRLPLKDNAFDFIIASEILEHLEDDEKAIKEIYRVLSWEGKAIITVPAKNYPFFWDPLNFFLERAFHVHLPSRVWWLAGIWADHQRLYSDEELAEKARKAGLKVEKCWQATSFCFPFSHFLFYALGKNLVEKGWFSSLNRFKSREKTNFFSNGLLKGSAFFEKINNRAIGGKRYLNFIMIVSKQK